MHGFVDVQSYAIINSISGNAGLRIFWRALRETTPDEATNIMELPAMPPILATFMPRLQGLYVRDCYVQLADLVTSGAFSLLFVVQEVTVLLDVPSP